MTSEALAQLLRRHLEAENARRMDDTLATLTEDCVFDDRALARTFHGRAGAADYYRIWWDAFSPTVTPSTCTGETTAGSSPRPVSRCPHGAVPGDRAHGP
jgi:SnoaL-like domain